MMLSINYIKQEVSQAFLLMIFLSGRNQTGEDIEENIETLITITNKMLKRMVIRIVKIILARKKNVKV